MLSSTKSLNSQAGFCSAPLTSKWLVRQTEILVGQAPSTSEMGGASQNTWILVGQVPLISQIVGAMPLSPLSSTPEWNVAVKWNACYFHLCSLHTHDIVAGSSRNVHNWQCTASPAKQNKKNVYINDSIVHVQLWQKIMQCRPTNYSAWSLFQSSIYTHPR